MMTLKISQAALDAMQGHARGTYPDECCGMIVERNGCEEVVGVSNVQNERHAEDPEQFPRTARIAYTMGREAVPILLGAERGEVVLRAIYHSHPDHEAYFSAEDREQALGGWNEPNYPHVGQIVMSVRAHEVGATKAFAWDASLRDYAEIPLNVEERCNHLKAK
jgi:proteasome lid subunit RPN8/RPN11